MNAAVLLRLLLPITAVLALLAGAWGIDQRAYQRGQLAATTTTLTAAVQQSGELSEKLGQLIDRHQQEQDNAKTEIERLGADLRSGAIRLHIRTAPAGGGSDPAAPGPGPSHAELDPATATALVSITASGDAAIRDLNTCIDRYHAVQQTLNRSTTP